jgi:RNA polymerase sigma factor (sigma-70 family)
MPTEGCDVNELDWLAERFEEQRPHLQTVAFRMLGSRNETDDAVQEAWLRLSRTDSSEVENLRAWLTTVVGRVCLDMLRARRARREEPAGAELPEPVITLETGSNPEQEALLADSVGLALLVVLETLTPSERLAFVLHDMFGVPFDEIAGIVERTPAATRQLASRARRRVRGAAPRTEANLVRQRAIVDAFLAAARAADFDALIAVLDPDVAFRIDRGPDSRRAQPPIVGARAVAEQIVPNARIFAPLARPAIVNGAAGLIIGPPDRPIAICGFTFEDDQIADIDLVLDPEKLPGRSRSERNAT